MHLMEVEGVMNSLKIMAMVVVVVVVAMPLCDVTVVGSCNHLNLHPATVIERP